jgi:hypothetical protein
VACLVDMDEHVISFTLNGQDVSIGTDRVFSGEGFCLVMTCMHVCHSNDIDSVNEHKYITSIHTWFAFDKTY